MHLKLLLSQYSQHAGFTLFMKHTVVFENDDFLLVNKPANANLHVNQRGSSYLQSLSADLHTRLFLVHRLDDATSGLLILAKCAAVAADFSRLFEQRQIEKYYLAVAQGKPSKKQGAVVGDLEKSRNGSYRLSRSRNAPSVSFFKSYSLADSHRFYLLKPVTGKTHQLRVVMKSLGVPIAGDRRYGSKATVEQRCYLHAYALRFCLGGKSFEFVLPPTEGERFVDGELQTALLQLTTPWQLSWPQPPNITPTKP